MSKGWQKDKGNDHIYHLHVGGGVVYPTGDGGNSATSTNSVFNTLRRGSIYSASCSAGTVSIEDHAGAVIMTLDGGTTPHTWSGSIKLLNGMRLNMSAASSCTVEFSRPGQDDG